MSATAMRLTTLAALLALPVIVQAEILAVPGEYATIQAALDASVNDGDTVLIEPGVYQETLRAPLHPIMIRGNTQVDSLRPVIDPSGLPDCDRLGCLSVSGPDPVLEKLHFRNGPEMYPRRQTTDVGGITCGSAEITIRDCLFDSTYKSISGDHVRMRLKRCVIRDGLDRGIGDPNGTVEATDCDFQGHASWALVEAGDSSRFLRCHFSTGEDNVRLLRLSGYGIEVRDCLFGPAGPTEGTVLDATAPGLLLTGNVFSQCQVFGPMVRLNNGCESPPVVRGNVFLNNAEANGNPAAMLQSDATPHTPPCDALIADSNCFLDSDYNGISCSGSGQITRNRFRHLRGGLFAAVFLLEGRFECWGNRFDSTGVALRGDHAETDARYDWWGDSTGPYHDVQNPQGRGDTIWGYVDFVPWYTDTLFFLQAPPEPPLEIPHEFHLTAYPNPFNATCRVRLEVPQPTLVRVELFDIVGRRIREVWAGAVAIDREVTVDAADLPSGVYFVRASDAVHGQTLKAAKLMLIR